MFIGPIALKAKNILIFIGLGFFNWLYVGHGGILIKKNKLGYTITNSKLNKIYVHVQHSDKMQYYCVQFLFVCVLPLIDIKSN